MENQDDQAFSANENARLLVQQSYDKIAHTYLDWTSAKSTPRLIYTENMLSSMLDPANAAVLELGCGAGVPGTQLLASRCGKVIANDISEAQVELARTHVGGSNVKYNHGDMTKLEFEPASLDGVVAFYSIIHLPRDEQSPLFHKIFSWLRPGGYLLCNLGATDIPGNTATNWLGSQMFWSGFNAETNLKLLQDAGFTIEKHEVLEDDEDGRLVPFAWFLASKGK